jgi:hypothetical protein
VADGWRKWRIRMKSDIATRPDLKDVLLAYTLCHVCEKRGGKMADMEASR